MGELGLAAFDLVMGADVAACPYEAAYGALVDTFAAMLAPRGRVLLACVRARLPVCIVVSTTPIRLASACARAVHRYTPRHASEAAFFTAMRREFGPSKVRARALPCMRVRVCACTPPDRGRRAQEWRRDDLHKDFAGSAIVVHEFTR